MVPVNLTLDIVGRCGGIEPVEFNPSMVPYLTPMCPLNCSTSRSGRVFLVLGNCLGDVDIDVNDPMLPLTLTGDARPAAHFGIPVLSEVTFSVTPPGSGFVVLDGATLVDNPTTDLINVGNHNLMAEPNSGGRSRIGRGTAT